MNGESISSLPIEHIAFAWHEWVYFGLLTALAVAWLYREFREAWQERAPSTLLEEGTTKQEGRLAKLKGPTLWGLVVAAFIAGVLHYEVEFAEITKKLNNIDDRLVQDDLDRISTVRDRLDPAFNRIFGPQLEASLENLRTAIRDKEMTLDPEDFKSLYLPVAKRIPVNCLPRLEPQGFAL
jgi:hypothetical protein